MYSWLSRYSWNIESDVKFHNIVIYEYKEFTSFKLQKIQGPGGSMS